MSFYLGAKFGRQFLGFLNHEDLNVDEAFLPDEKIYAEVKSILSENNQKFVFHQIVSERQSVVPVVMEPAPKVQAPVEKSREKPVPALAQADKNPAKVVPSPVAVPEKKPNVASVIAQELSRDADSQSVSKAPVENIPEPVLARPVARYKLQLGSYANRERALAAQAEWQSRGYAVELFQTQIPGKGSWYRLHLGSFASRDEALGEQHRLLNKFHQTAMILAQ